MSAEVSRTAVVAAPAEDVWSVLADFGDLARWVPEVDHSCLLRAGSPGIGTTRRVQVGRTTLLEAVRAWSPPAHLGYDITGLPPALRVVHNDWHLRPVEAGTEVTITTTVDAGPRPPQQLVARLVARRMATTSEKMLAGLAAALTTGDRTRA
ncbi:SRPBCC family protein [Acidimicrobiia bacterium EGI L10123]|uniref:SRPBCC family protein n=1 Tax=Salinilacustrithrix flava TaxID=2957203 RepID=UPI003D7C2D26|nr:SRPBCC family protein [Acidimicrobiia bacterium EGI L10123]